MKHWKNQAVHGVGVPVDGKIVRFLTLVEPDDAQTHPDFGLSRNNLPLSLLNLALGEPVHGVNCFQIPLFYLENTFSDVRIGVFHVEHFVFHMENSFSVLENTHFHVKKPVFILKMSVFHFKINGFEMKKSNSQLRNPRFKNEKIDFYVKKTLFNVEKGLFYVTYPVVDDAKREFLLGMGEWYIKFPCFYPEESGFCFENTPFPVVFP